MAVRKRVAKKTKKGYTWSYYFDYKDVYGKKKRITKSGFETKKEAERAEALAKEDLITGTKGRLNEKISFNKAFDLYIKDCNLKKHSIETYTFAYNKHLRPLIGEMRVTDLEAEMLEDEFEESSTNTKIGILKVVNNIIRYCIERKFIKKRDTIRIKYEDDKKESKPITDEQFIKILEKTYGVKYGEQYRMIFLIGYYEGLRVSEVCGLEVSDFDFEKNTITINRQLSLYDDGSVEKTGTKTIRSNAIIPIAVPLIASLKEYIDNLKTDELFMVEGGKILTRTNVHHFIRNHVKCEDGLEDFHFHCLRHGLASRLYKSGVDVKTTQMIMRHARIQTTLDIYTHLEQTDLAKGLEAAFGTNTECVKNVSKSNYESSLN